MIAPLLTIPAAAALATLAPIGRQQLPVRGCAAFLWPADAAAAAKGQVAMASVDPAVLRLAIDGAPAADLPRVAQQGEAGLGFAAVDEYRAGGIVATLALTIATRPDLRDGAAVPQATLRLVRDGGDELVVPLAGLVGCRALG